MRSPKSLPLLLGLVVLCSVAFVWVGCSDDSTPTTPAVTGDINDPDYLVVREQVVMFADSTLNFIKSGFGTMSLLPTDTLVDPIQYGPIDPHTDSASSVYTGGWHVIFISRQETTYSTAMRDSIQFRDEAGTPQPNITGLAAMTYKHRWVFNMIDTTVDFANFDGDAGVLIEGLNASDATINGSNVVTVHSRNYSVNPQLWPDRTRDVTITATVSNVVISQGTAGWSHSCPTSGTFTGTVVLVTQDGDATPVTTVWTATLIFDNGTAAATVRRGNTVWKADIAICDIPA